MMVRHVSAECLDGLAVDDSTAMHSRRDLQRIHRVMRTQSMLVTVLGDRMRSNESTPTRILELGAGDGSLMLHVAEVMGLQGRPVEITLLDRQPLIHDKTINAFRAAGWTAVAQTRDVLDWVCDAETALPGDSERTRWDVIVANLFLHHFENPELVALLNAVAQRCNHFVAYEPRRSGFALAASRLLGVIGANAVTRGDAVLSVHAGFNDHEITAFWPAPADEWHLQEGPAGPFSHCFVADRAMDDHEN